jgi:hypothetical protein
MSVFHRRRSKATENDYTDCAYYLRDDFISGLFYFVWRTHVDGSLLPAGDNILLLVQVRLDFYTAVCLLLKREEERIKLRHIPHLGCFISLYLSAI